MSADNRRAQMTRTLAHLRETDAGAAAVARSGADAGQRHDDLVRARVAELESSGGIACAAGCSHCCSLDVTATFPEIARVASFIEATFGTERRAGLVARIEARVDDTDPLTARERAGGNRPCVLLEDRRCSVYEARPLACRGWNSSDERACFVAVSFPLEPPSIPVNALIRTTALDLARGISDGVRESGLDDAALDLPRALLGVLGRLDDATGEWLDGRVLPAAMKSPRPLGRTRDGDGLWQIDDDPAEIPAISPPG
jgi:uncharacterized protein